VRELGSKRLVVLVCSALAGCVSTIPRGPDLGACADYPDGVYTYGEVGIGTCLAGPSDLQFFQGSDGATWLAVGNADPYRNYQSGSLLLLDWSDFAPSSGRTPIADLDPHAVALDPFVGGLGFLADATQPLMLAANRFSGESLTTTTPDRLDIVDLTDPASPTVFADQPFLAVGADPQPVVVDPGSGRAYVLNLTDHTITVIDADARPLTEVPVSPAASIDPGGPLLEGPAPSDPPGGSVAEVASAVVIDPTLVTSDRWTLTWVDGTWRLWREEPTGLARYSTGGDDVYVASGLGVELEAADGGLTAIGQPFVGYAQNTLAMWVTADGTALEVPWDSYVGAWSWASAFDVMAPRTGKFDGWVGGISAVTVDGVDHVYYEARESADAPPVIGASTVNDAGDYVREANPVVVAPAGFVGVGQPFAVQDATTGTLRMWVALDDGAHWSIGLCESVDHGAKFSTPVPVLALPDEDLAAPVVSWAGGRYLLWATRGDGTSWTHVAAWSYDGTTWNDVHDVLSSDVAYDRAHPPRLGLQAEPTSSWRVRGDDAGWLGNPAQSGPVPFSTAVYGYAFEVASGQTLGTTALGNASMLGITPGSVADVDGVRTLYATAWDGDGRPSIAAFAADGEGWVPLARDLVPDGAGGNVAGASSPVVTGEDGAWTMFYAATGADGSARMHGATSSDGLAWTPVDGELLASTEGWDAAAQLPHSVEDLGDGRIRVWYAGDNGSRMRIGTAVGTGTTLTAEPAADLAWQLNTGEPGAFDDTAVRDPSVLREGDVLHVWYAGFDGEQWRLGHATRPVDGGDWTQRIDPVTSATMPAFSGHDATFSDGGALSPVVLPDVGAGREVWYAGTEVPGLNPFNPRIGHGFADATGDIVFATDRFATAGDTLDYGTTRGNAANPTIPLRQNIDGIALSGQGSTAMILDSERGFLYVPSKKTNTLIVVDVRDDSTPTFQDTNYLDIEAVLVVNAGAGPHGFRDVVPVPGTDLLYVTSLGPSSVFVLDVADLADDDQAQAIPYQTVAIIPLSDTTTDPGPNTFTGSGSVGGSSMALSADGRYLWIPQLFDNSVAVVDRTIGEYGAVIQTIPYVGEAPWLARYTPDGQYVVVANSAGEVVDQTTSSTLVVLDADPTSPDFLSPVTWIANQ
jgi:DNA-binding beta-propeller fold protein YncE